MSFKRVLSGCALAALAAGLVLACSGKAPDEEGAASVETTEHGSASSEKPFSETVVHLGPDGSSKVDVYYRSAEEVQLHMQARLARSARLAAGAVQPQSQPGILDSPCESGDVQLWSSFNGGGDTICFYAFMSNDAYVPLNEYRKASGGTWAHAVESYDPTAGGGWDDGYNGYFDIDGGVCRTTFSHTQGLTNGTSCVLRATVLHITG